MCVVVIQLYNALFDKCSLAKSPVSSLNSKLLLIPLYAVFLQQDQQGPQM